MHTTAMQTILMDVLIVHDLTSMINLQHSLKENKGCGSEYFEFMIGIGYLELVAIGGFFGQVNRSSRMPFLCSTVLNLTEDLKGRAGSKSSTIYIRKLPAESATRARFLNQYNKVDSDRNWGFHSVNFMSKSYYPVNPLRFAGHSSGITKNTNSIYKFVSFVLRSFSFKNIHSVATTT